MLGKGILITKNVRKVELASDNQARGDVSAILET